MLEDTLYGFVRAYERMPPGLSSVFGAAYRMLPDRVKFGSAYEEYTRMLSTTSGWDRDRLDDLSWAKTLRTIRYAARKVPWYGRTWAEHGIDVRRITDPEDLLRLPTITKADVRENWREFVSRDARPRDALVLTTSGSTAEPLRLLYVRGATRSRERAFIHHIWRRVGYEADAPTAVLRGFRVRGHGDASLWRFDATRDRWVFSTVDMTEENCSRILGQLQRVRPEFLHVYPSALVTLCNHMVASGQAGSLPSVKAVLAGSESLHPWQVEVIRRAFGADVRIMRWYGMGEQVGLAASCEASLAFHVVPEYARTEVLRPDGMPATEPGEVGEIVGTTFDNWVMPLVRYRMADHARLGPHQCRCGRPHQLWDEVLGRSESWAITADGERMPFAPVLFGVHSPALSSIRRFQFEQHEPGVLDLWLTSWPRAPKAEVGTVVTEMRERVAPRFVLREHVTTDVQGLPSGKHEYFVQRMDGWGSG